MVGLRGESGYGVVERESLAMEPLAEFVLTRPAVPAE